ncbi:MAG: penicillin-binding transpeptidase domain-containing protein [bacterium]|nr:penicillin-binding transpeptidase domain-containing protein [bacterium]
MKQDISSFKRFPAFVIVLIVLLSVSTVQAQSAPDGVVQRFLDAWNALDYAAMYNLLSSQSRELVQQPAFEARYQQVTETIGLTGLTYTIQNTETQGFSAAVTYDVTLQSSIFGEIADAGRTMRLVISAGEWGVAWSTMDIFDVLSGDSALRVVPQPRERAMLYDRNGTPLVEETALVPLYGQKLTMPDQNACIALLSRLTRESVLTLRVRFAPYNNDTIFYMSSLDVDTYSLNLADLRATCALQEAYSAAVPVRQYVGRNIMWHAVGYIGQIPEAEVARYQAEGYSPGDLVGLAGVEEQYEDELAGEPERVLRIVEPGGTTLRELAGATGTPPVSVTLTLDRRLQQITAQAMSDAFNYAADNWGRADVSQGGAAVVLDVNTGAVLALVSYPLVDANLFNPQATAIENRGAILQALQSDPRRPLFNHATQDAYAPGSVFKIITHVAALNEGLTDPTESFDCPLEWDGRPYGDTQERRTDWRLQDGFPAAGIITPAQALMASCNPFYWRYGAELFTSSGADTLNQYARMMGLGQAYGLGEGETPGNLPTPGSAAEAMNNATGQGNIGIAPIQMAVAVAAIANGGTVYRPYLVQQVGGQDGTPVQFTAQPQVIGQLNLNPGVLENVREGMCGVTGNADYGTAFIRFNVAEPDKFFHPPATYQICGKTGTAQAIPYPHAWFVSYAPRENPQFAIVVMVTNSLEGSQVSAPITRRILDEYFNVPAESYAQFPEWWNAEPYTPLPPVGESGGSQ